jgi:hypothetical protein
MPILLILRKTRIVGIQLAEIYFLPIRLKNKIILDEAIILKHGC